MCICVFDYRQMVEKAKKVSVLAGSVMPESVKVVAESVGLADLPDAVLTYVADEVTFRLRHTVQVCLLIITLLAATLLDTRPCLALRARPWLRISQSYDLSDVDTALMLFAAATVCKRTESWQ